MSGHARGFLRGAADAARLGWAFERSQRLWERRLCLALPGGRLARWRGALMVEAAQARDASSLDADTGARSLPMPRPSLRLSPESDTGKNEAAVERWFEQVRRWYTQSDRPSSLGRSNLLACIGPSQRGCALGIELLAQGFVPMGVEPVMARDLRHRPPVRDDAPGELSIAPLRDPAQWEGQEHPFFGRWRPDAWRARVLAAMQHPDDVAHLLALRGEEIVGQASVSLSRGRWGVGAVYDLGVLGPHRGGGVGRRLTEACCAWIADRGARWVVLSATPMGQPLYRRSGFFAVGRCRHFWYSAESLAQPPDPIERAAVRAAAGCRQAPLDEAVRVDPSLIERRLTCGHRLIELSARTQDAPAGERRAVVDRLLGWGASLDPISAADLGGTDLAQRTLRDRPEGVDEPCGPWLRRPLHEAAGRGDLRLIRLLLAHDANPLLPEAWYGLPPAEWADLQAQPEAAELIRQDQRATFRLGPRR